MKFAQYDLASLKCACSEACVTITADDCEYMSWRRDCVCGLQERTAEEDANMHAMRLARFSSHRVGSGGHVNAA